MKRKIAILTWHYYSNFGSALQAYALQQSIKKLGYSVKILNYRSLKYGKINSLKTSMQYILHKISSKSNVFSSRYFYPFLCFQRDYLNETVLEQNEKKLNKLCSGFSTVVCGSDQIWAPNVFNPIYMLSFVPAGIEKVSYAASIGLNTIPETLISDYINLISDFKAVSVREKAGADLLKKYCGISAKVVLDPTLLIDVSEWEKIEIRPMIAQNEKFVFCYFLNSNHKYRESVKNYAKKNSLKIFGWSANPSDSKWMDIVYKNIGPCEFLWLIHHSEAVITDSYHGTNFSLLYHKKFITLERFSNDDVICQNSRIYQLKSYFSLEKQIVPCYENTSLLIETVNYNKFEEQLLRLRNDSLKYLENALEG